jgi:hypothetical protein
LGELEKICHPKVTKLCNKKFICPLPVKILLQFCGKKALAESMPVRGGGAVGSKNK